MAEPSTYQSLYRRYRSQRFDQVLGQDHITKALRNAVRDGRVGHAYLFSGPRGTGKTSTARILAKVLNCAAPVDGEPCGECANCSAVERGLDTDWLLEQDAASKSKVDDMRDLLDRVPLGTSGHRKVIILDEVHMLSQGAENALLKTLEEPPSHVVFVLATTDPQKVRPTIRSRTQHFEFHLLSAAVLAEHICHVIADADLPLSSDAVPGVIDHVVQAGGGSARDTLSALDQVAALGEVVVDTQPVDAILDAVAARNPGAVLVAVAEAVSTGREPRSLGEALIVRLRDAFLTVMGAGDDQLPVAERERARQLGEAMGPAGLTRALEVLGEALTELARKPDPRIVVEVALVRLARPDTDRSLDALAARLDNLERAVQEGIPSGPRTSTPAESAGPGQTASPSSTGPASSAGSAPPQSGGPSNPSSDEQGPERNVGEGGLEPPQPTAQAGPASAARAVLAKEAGAPPEAQAPAGAAEQQAAQSTKPGKQTLGALTRNQGANAANPASTAPAAPSAPQPRSAPAAEGAEPAEQQTISPAGNGGPSPASPSQAPAPSPAGGASPDLSTLQTAWNETVLGALPVPVRSRWRGGRWQQVAEGTAQFAVSNEWHKKACDEGKRDVEQALAQHFGAPLAVEIVIDGGGAEGREPGEPASAQTGSAASATGAGGPGGGAPSPSAGGSPSAAGAGGDGRLGPVPAARDDAEHIDMAEFAELPDADDVTTGGIALLVREFGGELITSDPSDA